MELNEFHVDQFRPGVIRKRVAVTGPFPRIRCDLVRSSDTAGRENDGLCLEDTKASMFAFVRETSDNAVAVLEQRDHRDLHVNVDTLMDAVVLKRADQFETRAVADVSKTRVTMSS